MKNKILIAVDLDDDYLFVINKGLELAQIMNAKVILASIVNIYVNYIQPDMATSPIQWDDVYNAQIEFNTQELEKIKMQNKNLEIEVFVQKGNSKTDIIEKANVENVNYMVMGTHGRTGISHIFMGSTAEYIIRHATKPIVVIPMNTLKH
ncbi:MAG: universal stress protein [Sediminibacterium sp.]|jgi:nucleotide-binding universal stress UspA family protein